MRLLFDVMQKCSLSCAGFTGEEDITAGVLYEFFCELQFGIYNTHYSVVCHKHEMERVEATASALALYFY
jgi:hypothetical protein